MKMLKRERKAFFIRKRAGLAAAAILLRAFPAGATH